MAQRNIDFGTFPDDPQADAIRTAFQKVQENFTEVYAGVEGASVASVNRTPGAGITVSSPTGNVIVTANIACVQVHTSTLSIGRDSNGAQDTSITSSSQTLWVDLPANIANVSNINLSGYATATGNVTGGNLVTGGQLVATGNVTGGNIITTGTFSVTGNANVGNLGTSGLIVATGNVTGGNLVTGGRVVATGNANVGNIGAVSGVLTGTLSVTGNANIGNLGTASVLATANITAPQLISNVAVGTAPLVVTSTTVVPNLYVSRANIADFINANLVSTGTFYLLLANATSGTVAESANANLSFNAANGALTATTFIGALSGVATSATTAGTVTTNAQPNITSVGTLTSLGVNGTITAVAVTANTGIFTGNGAGLTQLTGANVTGTVANATYALTSGTSGTVTTAAQPNITSVGTLTGLTAGGTINTSTASNVTLGNLANLHITGGSSGYTIKTDGAGNLSWGVDTAAAGGANTYVQYNDGDVLNGSANYTFNKVTNQLTLAGNIQTNNANLGNAVTANYFTGNFYGTANTANTVLNAAQPNITSVGTLISLTVSGGTANLGNVANVKMLGGSGYLYNDSSNNLTYQSVVTQTIPGAANALLYSSGSNNVVASGNIKFNDPQLDITGTLNVSGNANVGNIGATNIVGTLSTAAQPNITSVGTLAGLTVSSVGLIVAGGGNINGGNITATGIFSGNGSSLSQLAGANVTGTVANATYAVSAGSATTAGTVTTNAQPNITSVGTLTSLGVNGTVTAVAFTANTGVFTGNGNGLSSLVGANVTGTVANATYAVSAGSATSATNAAALLTTLTTTGTAYIPFISGTANGNYAHLSNANFSANLANGAITATTFVGSLSGAATSATNAAALLTTLTTTGTAYIPFISATANGNYAHLSNASFSANLANGAITATTFVGALSGTASLATYATTANAVAGANVSGAVPYATTANAVAGANVSGTVANATYAVSAGSASTAGTVTTNAQPNITSVGTLTSLTSSGNIQGANVIATAYHIRSVGTGITAAGTTQGTATVLSKEINIVSTVASGANGVVLPTAVAGMVLTITNTTANSLIVYPASGGTINALALNAGFTQSGTTIQFIAPSSTQWYTVGATYA